MNNCFKKFYKVGRIYWLKPKSIPGMNSKIRPGIMLEKYDSQRTIFLHLGSSKFSEKSSLKATEIFSKAIKANSFWIKKYEKSFIHIDSSKPEWNESILKPHFSKEKIYVDVPHSYMKVLRGIYHKRKKELEKIRINKAKIFLIQGKDENALKQIMLLKDKDPIKHSNLSPKKFIEEIKQKLNF